MLLPWTPTPGQATVGKCYDASLLRGDFDPSGEDMLRSLVERLGVYRQARRCGRLNSDMDSVG